jgi:quercetin dioxygenase-like cupin family protein
MIESWVEVKNDLLKEEDRMQITSSDNITIAKFKFADARELAWHSHESEQITIVLKGVLVIRYNNMVKELRAGEVCIIPENMPHAASITEAPFESFDIFNPPRQDFIQRAYDTSNI